jgi:hypothetical protein
VGRTDEIRARVSIEPIGLSLTTVTKTSLIKTLAGPEPVTVHP